MTEEARWNLQRGIPEDTRYKHTSYNIESEFDAYILARVRNKRIILDINNYNKIIDRAGEDIAAAAYKELDRMIKGIK